MKKYIFTTVLFLMFQPFYARAEINIFACETEWAALAEELGGDKVSVFSATTALQDPHTIAARPSLISKIRNADMLVCSGGGLEAGWLPILLQKAGKTSIQANGDASIIAVDYVRRLEVPKQVDRSMGDVHPDGNPHVHLNPNNLLVVSDIISEKLIAQDTENKAFYESRLNSFKEKMTAKIKAWEKQAAPLKNTAVIANHKNMSYLFDWLGMNAVENLEPKPGVPPTSKHLSELVNTVKNKDVKLIVYAPYESKKPANWLSNETDVPAAQLPYTVGGNNTSDLFQLFDETIKIMLDKKEK
ncbi:MAG: zinc ABC transporter substrate-binding protein [Lactobacillaceae bacterium]|jgi:zinc/manganese transport system substrate-binding protein|nr:zinc ABC transporter substrate-binding protein [Lactobacillaceae bacterium]